MALVVLLAAPSLITTVILKLTTGTDTTWLTLAHSRVSWWCGEEGRGGASGGSER